MKKVVRLTESDLVRLIKRVIKEDEDLKVPITDISKMSNTELYDKFIEVVKPNTDKVLDLIKQMKSYTDGDRTDIVMLETFVKSIKENDPIKPANYMGERLRLAAKYTRQIFNKFKI